MMSDSDYEELRRTTNRRLNLGCGDFPMTYWINLDADPNTNAQIHAVVPPIPLEDESLDSIFACHFLEHLDRGAAAELLNECWRCLVPGGNLALVVPDTREVLTRYVNGAIDAVEYPRGTWWNVADLDHVCAMFLYSTVQQSHHVWSYDRDTLARAMALAGFGQFKEIDRYRDPRIAQGAWYQIGIEGIKQAKKEVQ